MACGISARAALTLPLVIGLLLTLILSGCSQGRTGATAALPDRQAAREDQSEEQPHAVPADRYKDVQYRGGRDPVSGVAPGLDGTVEQAPLPPVKGTPARATAGKTVTATAAKAAPAASGKSRYDDAYRPPAKPASARSAPPGPAQSPFGEGEIIVVQPGDTVQSIAARYNVPVTALIAANNIRDGRLAPGQRLMLPD